MRSWELEGGEVSNMSTLILDGFQDLKAKLPDYTFSQLLYTVLRRANYKNKPLFVKTGWLLEIDDVDIYEAVEEAIKNESAHE